MTPSTNSPPPTPRPGRRRAALAAAALAAATALGGALLLGRAPARPAAPRLAAPEGSETTYQLRWRGESQGQAAGNLAGATGGLARGEIDVAGVLAIRGLGRAGDAERLGLRFTALEHARITILGSTLVTDGQASALVDRELVIQISRDGSLGAIAVPPGAPPMLMPVLRAIAVQLVVPGGRGDRYQARTAALFGTATSDYHWQGASLRRTRVRYGLDAVPLTACADCTQSIDGSATIALEADGTLRAIHDTETLRVASGAPVLVAENELVLEKTHRRPAGPAPSLAGWQHIEPQDVLGDEETRLAQIAGDLTLDELGAWITRYVATGSLPDEPVWMARVVAFLTLHPEHCDDLLALFDSPGLPDDGRLLILDMLVATGTAEAQAALRLGLDAGRERSDPVYAQMIDRLGFVEKPTTETIEYIGGIREQVADRHANVRGSALYTVGAAIGHIATVDRPAAVSMARGLESELAASTRADERAHLLVALGNADLDETLPTVLRHTSDASPKVRTATAMALHRRVGGPAGAALVGLSGDPDAAVQMTALHVLGKGAVDDADLRRLAAQVVAGAIPPGADAALVTTLGRGAGRIDEVGGALRVLLARNEQDGELAAQIRALLEG